MDELPSDTILRRVELLESRFATLEQTVAELSGARTQSTVGVLTPLATPSTPVAVPTYPTHPKLVTPPMPSEKGNDQWLGKVGIALLLFGLAFLFKYSVDQGWLTPEIRVGIGALLGLGLIYLSRRLEAPHYTLSQVMAGGGIASLYISIFAASQLFNLIPYGLAITLMTITTAAGFQLSVLSKGISLAIIALIGGLLTPFILHTEAVNISGLVGYTCMVMAGACTVYWFRGWIALVWLSSIGGLLIAIVGWLNGGGNTSSLSLGDKSMLEICILSALAAGWMAPVLRDYLDGSRSNRNTPPLNIRILITEWPVYLLTILTPGYAFFVSHLLWNFSRTEAAVVAFTATAIWAAASWALSWREDLEGHLKAHTVTTILLLTAGVIIAFRDNARMGMLLAEVFGLLILYHFTGRSLVKGLAKALHWVIIPIIIVRLFAVEAGAPFFNWETLVALSCIALTLFIARKFVTVSESTCYYLVAHIAILLLMFSQLYREPNGQGLASVVWGVYGVILLIVGLVLRRDGVRMLALATLLLVVGKLFVIDLGSLRAIWRILLFMGFGGMFLGLSYLYRRMTGVEGKLNAGGR